MFCVTSTASASSFFSCSTKSSMPAFESGKVSRRCVSFSFKKQTTKFVLCKSTPICLTSLVPPFFGGSWSSARNYSAFCPHSYSGFVSAHTVLRVRVQNGHTVSRALLSKVICRSLTPFLVCDLLSCHKHHTLILLLVSRPVRRLVRTNQFVFSL